MTSKMIDTLTASARPAPTERPVWLAESLGLGTSTLLAGGVALLAGSAVLWFNAAPTGRADSFELLAIAGAMLALGGAVRWLVPPHADPVF
jgi:hypothetical protein